MPFRTRTCIRSDAGWSTLVGPDPARHRVVVSPLDGDIYVSHLDPGLSPLASLEAGRIDATESHSFECAGPLWVRPASGETLISIVEELRTMGRA